MKRLGNEGGFTLLEVMAVIIIVGVIAAIIIPKLTLSTENARKKADVATAHQIKAALDRYQVENGIYPKKTEIEIKETGEVKSAKLIPKYIGKLDKSTTQQAVAEVNKGFGLADLKADAEDSSLFLIPEPKAGETVHTIMIYLTNDGLAAEVRAYDGDLKNVLWTSAN
ncbi:type II secretion system protein [Candidatus Desulfosporosinus nitrosoreducens]|uniref:type II secretion system protein n=1 Tax=Candidatus Desulfosporosinus nitrosoreducens TaxID=3401928 RepID=UPI0035ABD9B3